MKRAVLLVLLCIDSVGWLATAQEPTENPKPKPLPAKEAAAPSPMRSAGRRFALNFKGGTPQDLVDAISKQLDSPLNVIIPRDEGSAQLPPLKMANVTVDELFDALAAATERRTNYISGWMYPAPGKRSPQYSSVKMSHGFRTSDKTPDENSIWYFYREAPQYPATESEDVPPACRFWNLSPFLETFKVEDITTAVETGWKMQGATTGAKLSFHKDTKLLIGVGQAPDLEMVDEVLRQLEPTRKNPASPRPPATAPN